MMSCLRYTSSELKNVSKAALIDLVERQPEIRIPPKICSKPVRHMDKKHLIRILTGNYGYVKAPVEGPQSVEAEDSLMAVDEPEPPNMSSTVIGDVTFQADALLVGRLSSLSPSLGSDGADVGVDGFNPDTPGFQDVVHVETVDGVFEEPIANKAIDDDVFEEPIAYQLVNDLTNSEFANQSFSRPPSAQALLDTVRPVADEKGTSPGPPSPSEDEIVIDWYTESTMSDEDLLVEYFRKNSRLRDQISQMQSHKGKRQTFANLVRDYKFTLQVVELLKKEKWESESGHLKSKAILKHLKISASWLSRARTVTELLRKVGPESPRPDPMVVAQLSAGESVKGDYIIALLKDRVEALSVNSSEPTFE